jgi:hypothetical protein
MQCNLRSNAASIERRRSRGNKGELLFYRVPYFGTVTTLDQRRIVYRIVYKPKVRSGITVRLLRVAAGALNVVLANLVEQRFVADL